LQIIDRKKEILVTAGGKNVPPANIELRFADDPLFRHVVVYGDGKKYLTAGVWLAPEAYEMPDIEALVHQRIERMNQELASFERIRRHCIMTKPLTVENGLLTSTLKLRRKLIYQAFRDEFEGLYA
jgi:long-chain acyl-CoA synthetase